MYHGNKMREFVSYQPPSSDHDKRREVLTTLVGDAHVSFPRSLFDDDDDHHDTFEDKTSMIDNKLLSFPAKKNQPYEFQQEHNQLGESMTNVTKAPHSGLMVTAEKAFLQNSERNTHQEGDLLEYKEFLDGLEKDFPQDSSNISMASSFLSSEDLVSHISRKVTIYMYFYTVYVLYLLCCFI